MLNKVKFSQEGFGDVSFEGWHNPNHSWNGFLCPFVNKKTFDKIISLLEPQIKFIDENGDVWFDDTEQLNQMKNETPWKSESVDEVLYNVGGWIDWFELEGDNDNA